MKHGREAIEVKKKGAKDLGMHQLKVSIFFFKGQVAPVKVCFITFSDVSFHALYNRFAFFYTQLNLNS